MTRRGSSFHLVKEVYIEHLSEKWLLLCSRLPPPPQSFGVPSYLFPVSALTAINPCIYPPLVVRATIGGLSPPHICWTVTELSVFVCYSFSFFPDDFEKLRFCFSFEFKWLTVELGLKFIFLKKRWKIIINLGRRCPLLAANTFSCNMWFSIFLFLRVLICRPPPHQREGGPWVLKKRSSP